MKTCKTKLILLTILALSLFSPSLRAQLVFEPSAWDFGTIEEEAGRVTHRFTGENRSDRPIVILDVATSCGCTVPEFSRRPILPGEQTEIVVTFDPRDRPGTFEKQLHVYSTQRERIATLSVRGSVAPRVKSLAERYPVDAGGGVRLTHTLCAFAYVHPGERAQSTVGVVNTSDRPVALTLLPQRTSGCLEATAPREIAPGEELTIDLAYEVAKEHPHYGTLRDALRIVVDGRPSDIYITAHAIAVDPVPEAQEKRPVSEISENFVKFGVLKHDGDPARQRLSLTNTGQAPLRVRAVECDGAVTTTLAAGTTVAPGGSVTFEVAFDPRRADPGPASENLVIVIDDPGRPMRRIRLTAIVEQ